MVLEENWSSSLRNIQAFFLAQPDVTQTPQGFAYGACQLSLTPFSGTLMGKWPLERTVLRIEGPEEEVRQIHRRFFLQFLSAGG